MLKIEQITFGDECCESSSISWQDIIADGKEIGALNSRMGSPLLPIRESFQFCVENSKIRHELPIRIRHGESESRDHSIVYGDSIEEFIISYNAVHFGHIPDSVNYRQCVLSV